LLSDLGIPRIVSEKELDLSSPTRCHELFQVVAIVWHRWLACGAGSEMRLPLRFLSLRRSALSTAEHLVGLMRRHGLHTDLIGLDLSENKLDSLRFLFQLRADYKDRLLFLWLQGNPITRKPEYREQIRATLPRLVCLDGESIRRPPLSLPYPRAAQLARNVDPLEYAEVLGVVDRFLYGWESQQVPLPPKSFVPSDRNSSIHPAVTTAARERRKRLRSGGDDNDDGEELFRQASSFCITPHAKCGASDDDDSSADDLDAEEEIDENTFAKRYLHPECTFSLNTAPGCSWFDAEHTKCVTELDTALVAEASTLRGAGGSDFVVLSKQDMNELRVMDVSIRNRHRNLILGKPTLHHMVKGQVNCFTAYRSTLYPERMLVDHHLDGCAAHVTLVGDEDMSVLAREEPPPEDDKKKVQPKKKIARDPYAAKSLPPALQAKYGKQGGQQGPSSAPVMQLHELFQGSSRSSMGGPLRKPLTFLVALHGSITWRTPTMSSDRGITMFYDRTVSLVHRPLPPKGSLPPRSLHKIPRFVIVSDMVSLRPIEGGASKHEALFVARSPQRLHSVAVEFGLDVPKDNRAFVDRVAERATSDAALHHALCTLVGVTSSTVQPSPEDDDDDKDEHQLLQRRAHSESLKQQELERYVSSRAASSSPAYTIRPAFSAFEMIDFASRAVDTSEGSDACTTPPVAGGGSIDDDSKVITFDMLDRVIADANAYRTTSFALPHS
jgi:hypothetical protein